MRVIFCLPNTTHYNIMERLHRTLVKFIYNNTDNTVQSIVNNKLVFYPISVLSENYTYLMSKYNNLSLIHVLNKIKGPPLSVNELSECNKHCA